jgi:hypothetical protein
VHFLHYKVRYSVLISVWAAYSELSGSCCCNITVCTGSRTSLLHFMATTCYGSGSLSSCHPGVVADGWNHHDRIWVLWVLFRIKSPLVVSPVSPASLFIVLFAFYHLCLVCLLVCLYHFIKYWLVLFCSRDFAVVDCRDRRFLCLWLTTPSQLRKTLSWPVMENSQWISILEPI